MSDYDKMVGVVFFAVILFMVSGISYLIYVQIRSYDTWREGNFFEGELNYSFQAGIIESDSSHREYCVEWSTATTGQWSFGLDVFDSEAAGIVGGAGGWGPVFVDSENVTEHPWTGRYCTPGFSAQIAIFAIHDGIEELERWE